MVKQPRFFAVEERLARLNGLGEQLAAFSRTVILKSSALIWSRLWLIQTGALNNLSDKRTGYLIKDRLSFMRFLGLGLSDCVPDAKTLWLFRERLTQAGVIERLFEQFDATLRNAGYLPMSGQILDATSVAAPKQRNTNDEKTDLREGRVPQDWQDKPSKLPHKYRHAR